MTNSIAAQGTRSIAAHDIINSIVNTGDHNQFFIGDYERLRDAFIEPWQVFERVNLARFVGREWLLAEVDTFLRDHDRGYFVLEAEAGLGKTTFLAWLVRQRGYVHHFVELARGQEGVGIGLKNLGAQVVLAYHLNAWEAEGVLPGAAGRPDYLARLLKLAAERRQDDEKVVLVVDALDEAGTPMGENVLGLPPVLPKGVYVIASQRPVEVALQVDIASTPRRVFPLKAGSDENQADMRHYLEDAATWLGIAKALQESMYSAEQFVETLLEKCQGVWIYVQYVVHEIEQGERSPLDLGSLPDGMTQYYARYWRGWRDDDEVTWYDTYLPLLATLAAAQEAASAQRLLDWTGVTLALPRLRRLLNARWRPFLAPSEVEGETRYRFYHATLTEFFAGQVDQAKLNEAESAMLEELIEATQMAHRRLVDRYLTAWGGLAEELSGLREEAKRDPDGGYGLRHLASHLVGAGQWEELHRLVAEGKGDYQPWAEAKHGMDGSYAGYLDDLQLVWSHAAEKGRTERMAVGRQTRYGLIASSIKSLAERIPPELLILLVQYRMPGWTPVAGFHYAMQRRDASSRSRSLRGIMPYLPEDLVGKALDTVLAGIDSWEISQAVAALAPYLSSDYLAKLLKRIQEMSPFWFQDSLAGLAPHLQGELLVDALAAVHALPAVDESGFSPRVEGLACLIPYLSAERKAEALVEALAIARFLSDDSKLFLSPRAITCITLVPHLYSDDRDHVLADVLVSVLALPESLGDGSSPFINALTELLPFLPQDVVQQQLPHAIAIVLAMWDDQSRADALGKLAPFASAELLTQILSAVAEIPESDELGGNPRAAALTALVPSLPANLQLQALMVCRAITDAKARAKALTTLAQYLPEELRTQVFAEVLVVIRQISTEWHRTDALLHLAPVLPFCLHSEVLEIAETLSQESDRLKALVGIAPHLQTDLRVGCLAQALANLPNIGDEQARAQVLVGLSWYLPQSCKVIVLDRILALADHGARAKLLAALVPSMSGDMLAQTLAAARELDEEDRSGSSPRSDLIGALAPNLSPELLPEVLDAVETIKNDDSRAAALCGLAPHLSPDLLARSFTLACELSEEQKYGRSPRVEAIRALAPYLSPGLMQRALRAIRAITNERDRSKAIVATLPYLPPHLLPEATVVAREILDDLTRVEVLSALAPHLSPDQGQEVLDEALQTAARLPMTSDFGQSCCAHAILNIAPNLPTSLGERAMVMARSLSRLKEHDRILRIDVFSELARCFPPGLRDEVLGEAQDEVAGIESDAMRIEVFCKLAPRLSPEMKVKSLSEGLQTAMRLPEIDYALGGVGRWSPRAQALCDLAPYLSKELLPRALILALELQDENALATALIGLGPYLPVSLMDAALTAARHMEQGYDRVRTLSTFLQYLPEDSRTTVLSEITAAIAEVPAHGGKGGTSRAEIVHRLVPYLPVDLYGEYLGIARCLSIENLGDDHALQDLSSRWFILAMSDRSFAYQWWPETIRELASTLRFGLLGDLEVLAPTIFALGGEDSAIEAMRSIQDIGRWWP